MNSTPKMASQEEAADRVVVSDTPSSDQIGDSLGDEPRHVPGLLTPEAMAETERRR